MKAVVVYKWARNAADAIVRTDGSIDWRNARMAAGEDDPAKLVFGQSITDPCLGWDETLTVLQILSEAVKTRRRA